jgi:CheY-like chemotaxis protein
LILFDLQMPVRSGFEIMLALAASAADSDLPVIVIPAQRLGFSQQSLWLAGVLNPNPPLA